MSGTSRFDSRYRYVTSVLFACAALTATACTTAGAPTATSQSSSAAATPHETIRQTDDAGKHLPFTNGFPDRWSEGNDGSTYEPCTALADDALASFGLDPWSVRDAAGANKQTARGCTWSFWDSEWWLSQIVGNQPPIDEYKRLYATNTWFPDRTIGGRAVAVGSDLPPVCITYVWSGKAMIATLVQAVDDPIPPLPEICDRALAFTELTIGLIPE